MALGPSRYHAIGESPYPHEMDGVHFVKGVLPNNDPYHAWSLFELPDPRTGRLLEIDMLVMGYGALYLLELKAHPGRMSGDATDWYWQPPDASGRKVWVDPPYRLANLKAKILKTRLRQHIRDDRLIPYIQALVFLSHEDVINDLRADGRLAVVTRKNLRDALLKHRFDGAMPSWQGRRVSAPQVQAVSRALDKLGVRPRKGKLLVGDFELRDLTDEGPGYQDREATHTTNDKMRARARTYLVPEQTSVERRQQLRRAADREAALLYEVREHKNVLSWLGYVPDAPLGPTVLLDEFEGGQPLPSFLRNESLTFEARVELIEQVGHALSYCHKREVFHGGLSPEAVLVRRTSGEGDAGRGDADRGDGVEVRLTNFQLGSGENVEATSHWSALASSPWALYQAPELREGAARDARSDIYSLGSLAYYLFTGRHPADNLVELYEKLIRDHALDARLVDGSVPDGVAEAIEFATQTSLANRIDDADEWLHFLMERITEPTIDETVEELDPLSAKSGDMLGDLMVDRVLGQGASARVLKVLRESDNRDLAMKVSLEPDQDDRLRAEAEALSRLRHPRIVQLHEVRTIAGRTCLLLSLAGSTTLKRYLDVEGTVSLDFASRYGDDLLHALEHLEDPDVQVLHRDIKPANLGVGTAGKTAHHLTLFDFSLAHVPKTELDVGTSAYRDPFLPARGAWDSGADRWSAAITLHEMLTGVRPSYGGALDPNAELSLAAERFDAAVRTGLIAFFEKALHRDIEVRHTSAKDMRHAWFRVFEAPQSLEAPRAGTTAPAGTTSDAHASTPHASTAHASTAHASTSQPASTTQAPPAADEPLTDDEVRSIAVDTPIMALPLSFRARNALDRAGLLTAADLHLLPANRLSAVRGVGTKVAKQILSFRDRWVGLTGVEGAAPTAAAFAPDYAGDDVLVTAVGLDDTLAAALSDAGLRTLAAVAKAPAPQVEAIAERAERDVAAVRDALKRETAQASERGLPQSIGALLEELLPKRKKSTTYVKALFGLIEPFEGRLDVTASEVAEHFGKTRPNIYQAISGLRAAWTEHGALGKLEDRAAVILDAAGGAIPLARAADSLLGRVPHDPGLATPVRRARAAALMHIVAEVQKSEIDGVRIARFGRGLPWLLASQHNTQVLRRLGKGADQLSGRDVLASPGEAQRLLQGLVRGSQLERAPAAQIAEWAAAASERTACSALLELYPRDMALERALSYSANLLASVSRRVRDPGLTPEEVRTKVAARYPEAAPLPPRPELDALLLTVPLEWRPEDGRYHPPGQAATSALGTSYGAPTLTNVSLHPNEDVPTDIEVAEFNKSLRIAVEQRTFRVLGVNPAYAFEAAAELSGKLGVPARGLDTLLIAAMRSVMADKRIDAAVVQKADRQGPGTASWSRLVSLMRMAERRVIDELLIEGSAAETAAPLLLTRPGLLARYGLTDLLEALVARVAADDAQAIFVLVPCHDYGGVPQINDRHPIPGVLAVHALRVPRAFVPLDGAEAA